MFTTVTLHDGRTLEYADLGDPTGTPALFFHGTPATAGQAALVADAARTHGVRLVAVSRPGYGATTMTPPGLTSCAADACELADALGIDRFTVMGVSGGGPYALALAALVPTRPTLVVVLGGPGDHWEVDPEQLDADDTRAVELLASGDVEGATAVEQAASEKFFGALQHLTEEEFAAELGKTRPPGPDWFDAHPDLEPLFASDFRRAIATFDGFVRDNLSWLSAWDVDLTAITAPVRLVHGESDMMVPAAHGEWLHERLPTSERYVVPGGHGHATFGGAAETLALIGSD